MGAVTHRPEFAFFEDESLQQAVEAAEESELEGRSPVCGVWKGSCGKEGLEVIGEVLFDWNVSTPIAAQVNGTGMRVEKAIAAE